ncbi:MAG: helix-turn-helix domain-containing protein [Lachnospiraceae bacterium]
MERMVSFLKLPEVPILPETTTGFWMTMIRWNVDSFWEQWKNRRKVCAPVIVRAAWSLFGEKGYKDTSVADIIERAK